MVTEGAKTGRRAVALAAELAKHGVAARAGKAPADAALVIAPDGGETAGAHLVVRAEQDAEAPDWAAVLAPA